MRVLTPILKAGRLTLREMKQPTKDYRVISNLELAFGVPSAPLLGQLLPTPLPGNLEPVRPVWSLSPHTRIEHLLHMQPARVQPRPVSVLEKLTGWGGG